jgi:hypothetical protein
MEPSDSLPFRASRDLPPYRGILAVDAKGFTAEPSSTHQAISGLIPKLVGLAFGKAGLAEVWDDPSFFGPTGDGFAVGVPTRILPYLVHPFFAELQQVLARHNESVRYGEPQIRLRASLHVGPLPLHPTDPALGGNGTPRNETHRLLDSQPVRAILAAASPEVTYLAVVVSDRVYEDVVRAGYAGRHPKHFVDVSATVTGKEFAQRAWLYVPEPSGNLLLVEQAVRTPTAGAAVPAPAAVPPPPVGAQAYTGNTAHGPAAFGNYNTVRSDREPDR